MKRWAVATAGLGVVLGIGSAWGADCYVAQNGQTPSGTYQSWDTAASNVQEAVTAAGAGGTVWVGKGVYTAPSGNQVVNIVTALNLRGVGTRGEVIIDGLNARRGITVNVPAPGGQVLIDGFTITNCFSTIGGGVYVLGTTAGSALRNCDIKNNNVAPYAGGAFGGGLYLVAASYGSEMLVENCTIQYNSGEYGGGLTVRSGTLGQTVNAIVRNCLISHNTADKYGGGITTTAKQTADLSLTVENSTLTKNVAVGSTTTLGGGGIRQGSGNVASVNTIVFFNETYNSVNSNRAGTITWLHSCVAPALSGWHASNTAADPQFVDRVGNDFHVLRTSPCLNSGTNLTWMATAFDLDGHPRLDFLTQIPDRGCYELPPQGSIITIR